MSWSDYNQQTFSGPIRPLTAQALKHFESGFIGNALDVGCGPAVEAAYLLKLGWNVTGLDSDPFSICRIQELERDFPGRAKALNSKFEDLQLPQSEFDFIAANFSLPFCAPNSFQNFFNGLKRSLKPNGIICGQFFGKNDEWNTLENSKRINFHSKEEVSEHLSGLEVFHNIETEHIGPSLKDPEKFWHLHTFIAKRI